MIDRFRGENFFLSNMKPLDNWVTTEQGIDVPSSEHAYQANKFKDPTIHRLVADARFNVKAPNIPVYADGVVSKELAAAFTKCGYLRPEFEIAKVGMMLAIVRMKFDRNPDLAERLLATGDQELVEGNTWGDRFWGVDPIGSQNGQNNLGKILMQVRSELRC